MAEHLASQAGKTVLFIDKRSHTGGNAYDCLNEDGILIHQYGQHIFYANSPDVFAYLSQFIDWRPYEHRVLASMVLAGVVELALIWPVVFANQHV